MGNTQITFIGAGNMAGSLIGGLCKQGVKAEQICASAPGPAALAALHNSYAISTFSD